MSPESNVTFDHSHVMHVHVHWSVLFFCSAISLIAFQARDSPKTYSTGSSTLLYTLDAH